MVTKIPDMMRIGRERSDCVVRCGEAFREAATAASEARRAASVAHAKCIVTCVAPSLGYIPPPKQKLMTLPIE